MDDENFMKEALKEAEVALKEGNWPIGCVIELDGKIIARTHN
jgi:tRNA(adenine34) deaminase